MNTRKGLIALGGGLLLGVASVSNADAVTGQTDLVAEIATLKAQIAEISGQKNAARLSEAQAAQVKSLVRDVLADADTRASLLDEGMSAGYTRGEGFTINGANGESISLYGQAQVRSVLYNDSDGAADENETGVAIQRLKVGLKGRASEKLSFNILLTSGVSTGGGVALDTLEINWDLTDEIMLTSGQFKAPFSAEELISSSRGLGTDRSVVNEYFTVGRTQGIMATYGQDMYKVRASLNNGARQGEPTTAKGVYADAVDFSATVRGDILILGDDMAAFSDYSPAESSDDVTVLLGLAAHYQSGETGESIVNAPDVFQWTGDVTAHAYGATVAVSGYGMQAESNTAAGPDTDTYGLGLLAAYDVIPDKLQAYAKYSWILGDTVSGGDHHVVTAGVTHFMDSHHAKVSFEGTWAIGPNGAPITQALGGSAGAATNDLNGGKNEVQLKTQLQLLF